MYYAIPKHAIQAERFLPRPTEDRVHDETTLDRLRVAAFDAPEFCGYCGCVFHLDCASCVAGGALVA